MLTPGALTGRIDRLEGRSLVERQQDPGDRRSIQVVLTDEGRATWNRSVEWQRHREAQLLETLPERDKATLNRLLRRMLCAFEKDTGIR